jgi:hypothetical protein
MKCPSGLMTGRILGKLFFFYLLSVPIKGMDETKFKESGCPSRLRGWMKPSLKKVGDFTVAEGHGHPLVRDKE